MVDYHAYTRFYEKHGARHINEPWLTWDDIGSVLTLRGL
jgi:hypothetical protein